MKIAVTYDNGNVFQHFGHTESFKIYEVEEAKVKNSEIVAPEGGGHGALAGFLAEQGVQVVICGGLGDGAKNALDQAGILVYSGIEGEADDAVEKFISGELVSAGANCDHHGGTGEEEACGSGCGGGCGSCGGGCGGGAPQIIFEGKNAGKKVKVHYTGTLDDGSKFDSSYDRGETLDFTCGVGMMIPGFDKAVVEMNEGDIVDVHIMPEEAYGEYDENAVFTMELEMLPGAEVLNAGEQATLMNMYGQPVPVKVVARDETTITFDANHELAGKALNFKIELVSVE